MNGNLLKTILRKQLCLKSTYSFFGNRNDCYRYLGVKRSASKQEIDEAYRAKLREMQASVMTRTQKQIPELKRAHAEALRNLEKREKQQYEEEEQDSNRSDNNNNNQNNQNFNDSNQNNTKKQSWFKNFLQRQNYGREASKEEKNWGMYLFGFGILGVTGICYVIGSNLKDHSKPNNFQIILSQKDLQQAQYYHQEYQQQKEQHRLQQQSQREQEQQQNQNDGQLANQQSDELSNLMDSKSQSQKSDLEKQFEEYKNNSFQGWKGKDE